MAFSDVLPSRVGLRIVAIFVVCTIISVQLAAVPGVILREGLCESNIRRKAIVIILWRLSGILAYELFETSAFFGRNAWIRAECLRKDGRICYFGLDIVDYFL